MSCDETAPIATLEASRNGLTVIQSEVLSALLSGETIKAAAELADVDRSTVHRWLRDDWHFQAARNRGIEAIQSATITGLQALAQSALEVVQESIRDGDQQTAINVLKGLGLLSGEQIVLRSGNPGVLREESEVCTREAASNLKIRGWNIFPHESGPQAP
jgi:hypothetical protein